MQLLRKAVQAHRAYTDRVSQPPLPAPLALGMTHQLVHPCSKWLLPLASGTPALSTGALGAKLNIPILQWEKPR